LKIFKNDILKRLEKYSWKNGEKHMFKGVSVASIEMIGPTHQTLWNLIFK
jgi:hypothetical protein